MQKSATGNPAATKRVLLRAIEDEDWRAWGAAVGHPRLSEIDPERLVWVRNSQILRALAADESVPIPKHLRAAAALLDGPTL